MTIWIFLKTKTAIFVLRIIRVLITFVNGPKKRLQNLFFLLGYEKAFCFHESYLDYYAMHDGCLKNIVENNFCKVEEMQYSVIFENAKEENYIRRLNYVFFRMYKSLLNANLKSYCLVILLLLVFISFVFFLVINSIFHNEVAANMPFKYMANNCNEKEQQNDEFSWIIFGL